LNLRLQLLLAAHNLLQYLSGAARLRPNFGLRSQLRKTDPRFRRHFLPAAEVQNSSEAGRVAFTLKLPRLLKLYRAVSPNSRSEFHHPKAHLPPDSLGIEKPLIKRITEGLQAFNSLAKPSNEVRLFPPILPHTQSTVFSHLYSQSDLVHFITCCHVLKLHFLLRD
jgi:hypothetical protein